MGVRWAPLCAVLVAFAVSGCVSDKAPESEALDAEAPWGALSSLLLEGTDCITSSAVTPYNKGGYVNNKVGPFDPADTREDYGPRALHFYPAPIVPSDVPMLGEERIESTWHSLTACETGGPDGGPFRMGWVAMKIEPPAFDVGGADRHFFVSALSFNEAPVAHRIEEALPMVEVSPNLDGSRIEFPTAVDIYGSNYDGAHGYYYWEGFNDPNPVPREVKTYRFWLLRPTDGVDPWTKVRDDWHTMIPSNYDVENGGPGEVEGTFEPITFDWTQVESSPGSSVQRFPFCTCGTFGHMMDEDAAAQQAETPPEMVPTGGTGRPNIYWAGFDSMVTMGPKYDVTFDVTWVH